MKTIAELQQHLQQRLTKIYEAPEAAAMATQVLMHLLKVDSLQFRLKKHEPAPAQTETDAEQILQRLLQYEPLQYVLGTAHFYDLDLLVSPAVLIPRPETEELVHLIIQENKHKTNLQILDVGTGSGCIPIALALNLKTEKVYGLDISAEGLKIAAQNGEKYKANVKWLQADIFANETSIPAESLDIVVSNPPYVLETEKQLMRQNVLAYEPHLALFVPETDALLYYKRIADIALNLLKPGGKLYFEINEQYGQQTKEMLESKGFQNTTVLADLFDKDRFVQAEKPC